MKGRLANEAIDKMQAEELRQEVYVLRSALRAMHRRAQHAVTARERNDLAVQLEKAKAVAERRINAWLFEFDRVRHNHEVAKEIFEIAAKKLGLPHGRYHSVSDIPFGRKVDGGLYANVYLSTRGGIETFDIKAVVQEAIEGTREGAD